MLRAGTAPLVLVADDNADTRRMYATYLRAVGYRVAIAQDGEEAVATARAVRPAAVVLDLSMPGVDGWAAMGDLQADPRTAAIPVVVLTGHDLKAHLKPAAVSAGAASYLMKPCLPEQLEREVAVRISAKLEADARSRRVASAE